MLRKLLALSLAVVVSLLAASTAQAHKLPKPADYPFSGDLKKREAWQEKVIRHMKFHLRLLEGTGYILSEDMTKRSSMSLVDRKRRWLVKERKELAQTREQIQALQAALDSVDAAPSYNSSTGMYEFPDPHGGSWLVNAFLCIKSHEGAWTSNTGNGYYGGLQMDYDFMSHYGPELLASKGTADKWTPDEQIAVAIRAYNSGRGFYPWPNTARMCGLI